ncbi:MULTISPECIES: leucyl aminopeptidase [unclassified Nesterenkonia]|uniref:leucyl aminopeptidase n=1 Tax=unclassified Nesterenkonia TaxID=2629769 RepID=UPI000871B68B|nr:MULTISPECIES: leucyl aminopeptidase [unclassified Nesterenkonia]MDS2171910.1 leucyl aminopeptidase [Nesterenkonia sp. CL21]OSM44796.1 leucyl aminopeptidase [Nesterenkonia sp. PF2B19]
MINDFQPTLSAVSTAVEKTPTDALVLGVAKGPEGPILLPNPLADEAARGVADSLQALGATGAADQLLRLPGVDGFRSETLVLVGVGELTGEPTGGVSLESLRRAAGSAVRQLSSLDSVALALPASSPEEVAAVAEGAAIGAYSFTAFRSSQEAREKRPVEEILILTDLKDRHTRPVLDRAAVVGAAVRATRDLVNTPPSHLYPETFAEIAADLAGRTKAPAQGGSTSKAPKLSVKVWDVKDLEKEGFGGLLGVGGGSSRGPRMVRIEHAPSKPAAHIALVGKGITFDSGGLSLKPAASMTTMKLDMGGAATVLAVVRAAADLNLPIKVTGWLCLAENMPSATAQRPEDVITIRGGKTVEVLNTDAEGRLVMADGLVAASEENPDALIDVATLTGAQMIALGLRTTGVMGEEQLRSALVDAAEDSGEKLWPMPIPEEARSGFDSEVADLTNLGDRNGGMLGAAAFLREFVGEREGADSGALDPEARRIPWAHLDIAGPAFNEKSPYGYTPKAGTGVMVRTLVTYLEGLSR